MSSFEEYITKAVRDGVLPGAVLYAKDKSANNKGDLDYSKIISPSSPSHIPALQPSTTLFLASATKLITTVAVLQLVERGLVTLDEDISSHVPALASQQVLRGFEKGEEGKPILEPRNNPLTLRALLTHSAGTAYDFLSPSLIQRWQALHGIVPVSGGDVEARFSYPLLHQPGEDWTYGNGIDWAGRVVEVLTGVDLGSYMQTNIFGPLGLTSFTFSRAEVVRQGTLWPLSGRDPSTGKVVPYTGLDLEAGATSPLGGQGLYGRMDEYVQILHSLLVDDGKLLRPETAAAMFEPQLGEVPKRALLREMEDPSWTVGDFPVTREYDWGLGGLLVDGDAHPHRKRGMLIWGGAANISWWIDREAGLAGVFGTQIMPSGEVVTEDYIKAFEGEMYARVAALKRGGKKQ
ncbi:acyltransferase LovD [Colletotrichum spaethianum]|uniref:Acyltransferase LovD n=1 Tax=Colletotrichum spaethianum TaxID=700344 RepID=A0AA37LJB3_9PEZI|nr:acyltransferase LovD [Colletotrichum spaethianum]GKT47065.1 acyltransferase LovD [Colletotrichum spaethianum]